jgi:hypothetical protein
MFVATGPVTAAPVTVTFVSGAGVSVSPYVPAVPPLLRTLRRYVAVKFPPASGALADTKLLWMSITGPGHPHALVVIAVLFVPYFTVAALYSPWPGTHVAPQPMFVAPLSTAALSTAETCTVYVSVAPAPKSPFVVIT